MNANFPSQLIAAVRFPLAVAIVAMPVLLLTGWLGAECPHEKPMESLCPLPPTTVHCDSFSTQPACIGKKGQDKEKGLWICNYTQHLAMQCYDSTSEALCYTEYDCYWSAASHCENDEDSAVQHNMVIKTGGIC